MTTTDSLRKQIALMFGPKLSGRTLRLTNAEMQAALDNCIYPFHLFERDSTPGGTGWKRIATTEPERSGGMASCKNCHAVITWKGSNGNQNWIPVNDDGTDHRLTCTSRTQAAEVEVVDTIKPVPAIPAAKSEASEVDTALEMLRDALSKQKPAEVKIDEEAIVRIVNASLEKFTGNAKLTVQIKDLPIVEIEQQHERFPILLAIASAGIPVMLVGPAGSGKTTACANVAKALARQFYSLSMGPQTSKSDLLGFVHANGGYVTSVVREAFEKGGVLLLDEIDAANAAVLTVLNSLLSNGHSSFPDAPQGVTRHESFVCVCAANTFGNGADRQYVGRNQLDAATLDRFFTLEWNYDWTLTSTLLGIPCVRNMAKLKKSGYTIKSWFEYVSGLSAKIAQANIRAVIGPRAALYGAKLLDIIDKETLLEGLIFAGMSVNDKRQAKGL